MELQYGIFNKGLGGMIRMRCDEKGRPYVYPTREEAEQEIARSVVLRILQQFHSGPGDGEDGEAGESGELNVQDYVREVEVLSNGVVRDPDGNHYGIEV